MIEACAGRLGLGEGNGKLANISMGQGQDTAFHNKLCREARSVFSPLGASTRKAAPGSRLCRFCGSGSQTRSAWGSKFAWLLNGVAMGPFLVCRAETCCCLLICGVDRLSVCSDGKCTGVNMSMFLWGRSTQTNDSFDRVLTIRFSGPHRSTSGC